MPSVVRFIGAFQDSRQMYIVMQHCPGGDLLELLLREGRPRGRGRVCTPRTRCLLAGRVAVYRSARILWSEFNDVPLPCGDV